MFAPAFLIGDNDAVISHVLHETMGVNMSSQAKCTIIVPLRQNIFSFVEVYELLKCYDSLIKEAKFKLDVLLLDNSPDEVANRIKSVCASLPVRYVFLPQEERISKNQKMDAIWYGLKLSETDEIILFDDDIRPTPQNIERICEDLGVYALVKCIIDFMSPKFVDKVDLAGIYAFNQLSKYGQTWGNISFLKSILLKKGFPRRDVLYDELAIERSIRDGRNHYYRADTPIPMKSGRSCATFLNQRIRYAYENIAFPLRFLGDLLVLPVIGSIALFEGITMALVGVVLVSSLIWCASLSYESKLSYSSVAGLVWPYAALWYWCYPIAAWWAAIQFVSGVGTKFQHKRIWRVV